MTVKMIPLSTRRELFLFFIQIACLSNVIVIISYGLSRHNTVGWFFWPLGIIIQQNLIISKTFLYTIN